MKKLMIALALVSFATSMTYGEESLTKIEQNEESLPGYLYKVLSTQDWKASQNLKMIQLSAADREFIHFSKEDQLERIISKYWKDEPQFIVLKIDPAKLPGKMVFETNPGGSSKYYHLYDGSIPMDAIVESKEMKNVR